MTEHPRVLAVIPARGGSKGLPGKNIRPFAGLPLIAHSVLFARMCPEIDRCIISTDSEEIADVARQYGADVPFQRPAELADDDTAMGPVLQHALAYVEEEEGKAFDMLLLLDPTCPAREPSDISGSVQRLIDAPTADGVIGVSPMEYSAHWECVVEQNGWMNGLIEGAEKFVRRQDVPIVYHINGLVYIWRTNYLRTQIQNWRETDKHVIYVIPETRIVSINTLFEFDRGDVMVKSGLINLPWLNNLGIAIPELESNLQ